MKQGEIPSLLHHKRLPQAVLHWPQAPRPFTVPM